MLVVVLAAVLAVVGLAALQVTLTRRRRLQAQEQQFADEVAREFHRVFGDGVPTVQPAKRSSGGPQAVRPQG